MTHPLQVPVTVQVPSPPKFPTSPPKHRDPRMSRNKQRWACTPCSPTIPTATVASPQAPLLELTIHLVCYPHSAKNKWIDEQWMDQFSALSGRNMALLFQMQSGDQWVFELLLLFLLTKKQCYKHQPGKFIQFLLVLCSVLWNQTGVVHTRLQAGVQGFPIRNNGVITLNYEMCVEMQFYHLHVH